MDSETRKVQRVGESTLTVSLPKEWVDTINLEAGDEVTFEETDDGGLVLHTSNSGTEEELACIVDADACTEEGLLQRALVGAYILGYETITVESDSELGQDLMNEIYGTIRQLTGINIVEETHTTVTLHNFMDVSSASIYVIIRRLYRTVLHMLDSAVYALIQDRPELIEEMREMEDDADVLYWLSLRQLLSSVEDDRLREDIGINSPLHIVGNRTAVKSLEEMADCIEEIGEQVSVLLNEETPLSQAQKEELAEVTEFVHDQIQDAVEGLIKQDIDTVNDVLEREDRFQEKKDAFLADVRRETDNVDTVIAASKVMWNLERVYGYSAFVAEIGVNRVMEDESTISTLQPMD